MNKNLYWKIQTIPSTGVLLPESKEFELFRNKNKNQETGELLNENDTLELYNSTAGKNPLFGLIYSLSVAFVDEDSNSIRVKVFKGDEKSILQSFINTCNSDFFKGFKLTGYNFSFLLPFMRSRMLKNNMDITLIPDGASDLGRKPWSMVGFDLQDYYKGVGWFQNSLEELAYLCNIKTNFIDGKDIYPYFLSGREKELEQSIIDETAAIVNCHRVIIGEVKIETVQSTVEIVGDVKVAEIQLIEKIFNSKNLTTENKAAIKELVKKKKATKKEKQILLDIVRAALSDIDCNFGKVKNELTVNNIIDELTKEIS